MDDELREAKRAFDTDRADEVAARRYRQSLLRAGRDDEVRSLFQVKFACPKTWDQLAPTSRPDVRSCDECKKDVFFAPDRETLAEHVRAGRCVTTPSSLVAPATSELSQDDELTFTPGPCLVSGGSPAIESSERQSSERSLFRPNRWVPLRRDPDGVVVVAVAAPHPALDRATPPIRTVLVSKDELERLTKAYPEEIVRRRMTMGIVIRRE